MSGERESAAAPSREQQPGSQVGNVGAGAGGRDSMAQRRDLLASRVPGNSPSGASAGGARRAAEIGRDLRLQVRRIHDTTTGERTGHQRLTDLRRNNNTVGSVAESAGRVREGALGRAWDAVRPSQDHETRSVTPNEDRDIQLPPMSIWAEVFAAIDAAYQAIGAFEGQPTDASLRAVRPPVDAARHAYERCARRVTQYRERTETGAEVAADGLRGVVAACGVVATLCTGGLMGAALGAAATTTAGITATAAVTAQVAGAYAVATGVAGRTSEVAHGERTIENFDRAGVLAEAAATAATTFVTTLTGGIAGRAFASLFANRLAPLAIQRGFPQVAEALRGGSGAFVADFLSGAGVTPLNVAVTHVVARMRGQRADPRHPLTLTSFMNECVQEMISGGIMQTLLGAVNRNGRVLGATPGGPPGPGAHPGTPGSPHPASPAGGGHAPPTAHTGPEGGPPPRPGPRQALEMPAIRSPINPGEGPRPGWEAPRAAPRSPENGAVSPTTAPTRPPHQWSDAPSWSNADGTGPGVPLTHEQANAQYAESHRRHLANQAYERQAQIGHAPTEAVRTPVDVLAPTGAVATPRATSAVDPLGATGAVEAPTGRMSAPPTFQDAGAPTERLSGPPTERMSGPPTLVDAAPARPAAHDTLVSGPPDFAANRVNSPSDVPLVRRPTPDTLVSGPPDFAANRVNSPSDVPLVRRPGGAPPSTEATHAPLASAEPAHARPSSSEGSSPASDPTRFTGTPAEAAASVRERLGADYPAVRQHATELQASLNPTDPLRNLTPDQFMALRLYTHGNSEGVGGRIHNMEDQAAGARNVDFRQLNFRNTNEVLRGTRTEPGQVRAAAGDASLMNAGLDTLPPHVGQVTRTAQLSPEILARYSQGATVTEAAYTSASLHDVPPPVGALRRPGEVDCRFVIQSQTGRNISGLSTRGRPEGEVLFRPGTEFRVSRVEQVGNQRVIHLEEVPRANRAGSGVVTG